MRNCRQLVKSHLTQVRVLGNHGCTLAESLMEELASAESRVSEKEAEDAALRATSEAQALRIGSFESKLMCLRVNHIRK